MVDYATIQAKIDRGKGKAGSKLGQPYDVYRLEPDSSRDFPVGWTKIASSFSVFPRRLKGESSIESAISNATLFYDLIADMTQFQLGDVFMMSDPPYDPGVSYGLGATKVAGDQFNGFTFAWHPPVRKAIGGRCDRLCRIYRPGGKPAPLQDGNVYWRSFHQGDQPFVLIDGVMALGGPGELGSLVPCGFVSAYRPYGPKPFDPSPPGMLRPSHWFCYLPPLPGYTPREGDAIITQDDARYVVIEPFFQQAGVVGSQMMMDRTSAQKT